LSALNWVDSKEFPKEFVRVDLKVVKTVDSKVVTKEIWLGTNLDVEMVAP
jgi:hypothetical protein